MRLDRYELVTSKNLLSFEFTSEGPKGRINKLILFTATDYENIYNLAFGDKHPVTGEIDDSVISNNGDSEKVLSTVVATIYEFTNKYPEAMVYATGSTKSRTRLYQMGIAKYLEEASADYEIYGRFKDEWETFTIGKDYESFVVKRKISNFGL
jgi:hypothetical protein